MSRHSRTFFLMLMVALLLHLALIAWLEFPKRQAQSEPQRSVVHMVRFAASQSEPVTTTQASSAPAPETTPPQPKNPPQPKPPLVKPVATDLPQPSNVPPPTAEAPIPEDPSPPPSKPETLSPQPVPPPPETVPTLQEAKLLTAKQIDAPSVHDPDQRADYEAQLAAWIERHKRYPVAARRRHMEGDIVLRVRINREGKVMNFHAERVSSHGILDEEAMKLIKRADPFPPFPAGLSGSEFEFLLPIRYRLR